MMVIFKMKMSFWERLVPSKYLIPTEATHQATYLQLAPA